MQGTGPQLPAGLRLGLIAAACGFTVVAGTQLAGARAGSVCNDAANSALFTFDDQGLASRVSASYNDDFMGGDKIAATHKSDASGTPTSGAGSCTDSSPFASMEIRLGGRADRGRLDATRPASLDVQATDPIPSYVAVVIDAGDGDDVVRGHKGSDTMLGRRGRDVIDVAGGGADTADCGAGIDKAIASANDSTPNCEQVIAG